MSITDPISDMITRIRNAQMRFLSTASIPNSKFRAKILDVLKDEGFISDYKLSAEKNNTGSLIVNLKYNNGLPVIREITRVSKPGRRIYSRANSIPRVMNGLGLAILSTPKGVMSDNEARKNNIGGEIICRVF